MKYSLLFAAVLILVSGFIAYFGDLLGRSMGKKRLTLWKLRPKHTAYIVTALTGMLIAALTLSTLIRVNHDFNRLWVEGDRILAQNKKLSEDNKSLAAQSKLLGAHVKKLQNEVAQAEEERLKAVEAQIKAVQAQKKAAETVKRLENDIAARTRQIALQEKQLADLKRTSQAATAELQARTAELTARKAELKIAQGARDKARADLKQAQADLKSTQKLVAEKQAAVDQMDKALKELNAALDLTQQALVKTGREAMAYEQQATQLFGGDIRFRQGDEIYRGVVSPRQSLFAIRGDVYSILDIASDRAAKAGAGSGPNGRAVILPQFVIDGQRSVPMPESSWVDQTSRLIARGALTSPDTLLRVVCIGNSLAGEQVPIKLVPHYNKLVYRKGDLIASTTLNGRLSEGRVLLAVIGFLQNEVSVAGLKAGIIPVSNPDPRASLGADPRTQVEGLMAVVDQVKAQGTRVNVEAYASADVYAAGPLSMTNMRFSVTRIE